MILALVASAAVVASPALAQRAVTTLEGGMLPSTTNGTTFTSNPADNTRNDDGTFSSATLTGTSPISANGSIEIQGRRSRVYNNMTGLNIAANTLGSLTADYQVNNGSTDGIQSPAFRVYVNGTNAVSGFAGLSELIWEAANNGGYTLGTADTVNAGDLFWRQIVGVGYEGTGGIRSGGYVLRSLADWGDLLGGTVAGIGVGNGGCPGNCSTFSAYADNLTLTTDSASYGYDFQTAVAAVPEPATWAMMVAGFAMVGFAARRRARPARVTA
jgi:hypothetical protein